MRNKILLIGLIALALVLVPHANAALRLTLETGGTTVVINDGQGGDILDGVVIFAGAIGGWSLSVTTGIMDPVFANPLLDLNSVDATVTSPDPLTLTLSANDYPGPVPSFTAHIGGTLGAGHSLTYKAYVSDSNNLNDTQTQIGNTMSFSNPSLVSFSGDTGGGSASAALYSLTQVVVLSATRPGISSFDANINAVPEPTSVVLFGTLLIGAGVTLRRRFGKV
jgi:hypothetical protein